MRSSKPLSNALTCRVGSSLLNSHSSSTALPPTFLLPFQARFASSTTSTTTTTKTTDPEPPSTAYTPRKPSESPSSPIPSSTRLSSATDPSLHHKNLPIRLLQPQLSKHTPSARIAVNSNATQSEGQDLLFRALVAQQPHHFTVHIHARPYMVTQGDIIRLPFVMPDVTPGTTLRLNRVSLLGSRNFTMRGGGQGIVEALSTSLSSSEIDKVEGQEEPNSSLKARQASTWIDERLYVCRALVMGVESEPMRFIEKTKRRQRHTKTEKSKLRYTILRIVECRAHLPEGGS